MPKTRRKDQPTTPPNEPRQEKKGVLRREIALALPDLNDPDVLARLKASVAALDPAVEEEALRWAETVSMFDNEDRDIE
jgi:hypothetical protein